MTSEPASRPTVLFVGGAGKREAVFWNAVAAACEEDALTFFGVYQGFWEDPPSEITFRHLFTDHFDRQFTRFFGMARDTSPEETVTLLSSIVVPALSPQIAVVWNGIDRTQYTWSGHLRAAGVATLIAERGAFPGLFFLESEGINGSSEFLWDEARMQRCRDHTDIEEIEGVRRILSLVRNTKSVSYRRPGDRPVTDLRESLQIRADRRIVLFLGSWDEGAGISHHDERVRSAQSPLFESSRAAALALAEAARQLPDCHLVLRPHPFDRDDWSALAGASTHLVLDGEVTDLIEQADVVAGLTTNLLYYAAACEKPVVLMGRTALYGYGFTYDLSDPNQCGAALEDALSRTAWNGRIAARDRFFAEYFFRFCYSAEEDFLALGVRGPKEAAKHLRDHLGENELVMPDAAAALSAIGTAVVAVHQREQDLEARIRELQWREKQHRNVFRYFLYQAGRIRNQVLDYFGKTREERGS
jgi:hypothetical protein